MIGDIFMFFKLIQFGWCNYAKKLGLRWFKYGGGTLNSAQNFGKFFTTPDDKDYEYWIDGELSG